MTIILIITGVLVALCLVMAAVSGAFSAENLERHRRELEIKREIKRERKRARKQRSYNEVWPWWLN